MQTLGEIRDPLVGTRIDGRYLVKGILGRGGMGVVYDGVHEQLGRLVAIKVLGAGIASDPTAVARFLREARTASHLTHGNIVDVSDLGQLPDGRPYLVMAKMIGIDLANLLVTQGPQTPLRTVELLRGAASALDLIHAKGFVHRDVKPENLMHVVREDGSEAVLLLDFGIVGLISNQAARLTGEGSVFGTPAYLPPEVIGGAPPDRRADVYALATVAFELIAGRTPFSSPNPLRILPMKLLENAPSLKAVTNFNFPIELEQVLAMGLVREPEHRYASAGAFIEALAAAARRTGASDFASSRPPRREGLDRIARDRLYNTATADLEMPITSERPRLAADDDPSMRETVGSDAPVPGVRRFPRKLFWASLAAMVAGGVLLWLVGGSEAPPPSAAGAAQTKPMTAPTDVGMNAEAKPGPAEAPAGVAPAPATAETVAPVASPGETATPPARAAPSATHPPPTAAGLESAREAHRESRPQPRAANPPPALAPIKPTASSPPVSGPNPEQLAHDAKNELTQGHFAAAAKLYVQLTKLDPRDAHAWGNLGLANENLGRRDEAINALRHALAITPIGLSADALRGRLRRLGATP
jgi:serine/threonine protein kinase